MSLPEQPICYIKYHNNSDAEDKTFRSVAVNQTIYNRSNMAAGMSYDDFFEQRIFSGYIVKETNVFDMKIANYDEYKDDPIAALLESEKINQKLFDMEHDMWEH